MDEHDGNICIGTPMKSMTLDSTETEDAPLVDFSIPISPAPSRTHPQSNPPPSTPETPTEPNAETPAPAVQTYRKGKRRGRRSQSDEHNPKQETMKGVVEEEEDDPNAPKMPELTQLPAPMDTESDEPQGVAPAAEALVELLEAILQRAEECAEEADERISVNSAVAQRLGVEVSKARAAGALHTVPCDLMLRFLTFHTRAAALRGDPKVAEYLHSIDILSCIFAVLGAPEMPSAIYTDEILEDSISTTKQILTAVGDRTRFTKYKVDRLSTRMCGLMERINEFVGVHSLEEMRAIEISSIMLPLLFIEGVHNLQLSAIEILRSLFSRYPSIRTVTLQEIFSSLTAVKKPKRTYMLEGSASIHTTTALVLQLLQSCTGLATPTPDAMDVEEEPTSSQVLSIPSNSKADPRDTDSFLSAVRAARCFIDWFMKRCFPPPTNGPKPKSKEVKESKTKDYRDALNALVEDLISLLFKPEWPAAEVLLHLLCSTLIQGLSNNDKKTDLSLRTIAVDVLGDVCAALRKAHNDASRLQPPKSAVVPQTDTPEQQEDATCICGKGWGNLPMLDCDRCHRWFHFHCVGLPVNTDVQCFYCDQCLMEVEFEKQLQEIQRQIASRPPARRGRGRKRAKPEPVEAPKVDGMLILKQLLLNGLALHQPVAPMHFDARHFHLAMWAHHDREQENCDEKRLKWYQDLWDAATPSDMRHLTPSGSLQVSRHLALTGPLMGSFKSLLQQIIQLLQDGQIQMRNHALKALTVIIKGDPSMLADAYVHEAVRRRFADCSIKVREGAVNLIGQYIFYQPELAQQYYEMIVNRHQDKGTSVRKKVIQILKGILMRQPDHPHSADICGILIKRIHDSEESVKKEVVRAFEDLWFKTIHTDTDSSKPTGAASRMATRRSNAPREIIEDDNSNTQDTQEGPTPTVEADVKKGDAMFALDGDNTVSAASADAEVDNRLTLAQRVQQILHTVERSTSQEWLVEILKRLLAPGNRSQRAVRAICKQICDGLAALLLHLQGRGEGSSKRAVDCIRTLGTFSQVDLELVLEHMDFLSKALIIDPANHTEHDLEVIHHVLPVVHRAIPVLVQRPTILRDIERSLIRIVMRVGGLQVLRLAIQSLSAIVSHTQNYELFADSLCYFFKYLQSCRKYQSTQDERILRQIRVGVERSIAAVSLLVHDFNCDEEIPEEYEKPSALGLTKGNYSSPIFEEVLHFTTFHDLRIRCRAIVSLGDLFPRNPTVFVPRCNDLFTQWLGPSSPPEVKIAQLRCLISFLTDEEEKATALSDKRTKVEEYEDEETDFTTWSVRESGVASSALQCHQNEILPLLQSNIAPLRLKALQLVGIGLRQGILHPLASLLHLIPLVVDSDASCREEAHRLFDKTYHKHSWVSTSAVLHGIVSTYHFQMKIRGAPMVLGGKQGQPVPLFGRLYAIVKNVNKTKRKEFLKDYIRYISTYFDDPAHCQASKDKSPAIMMYLIQILATLPFTVQDEPLFLIQQINQVAIKGADLKPQLKALLKEYTEQPGDSPVTPALLSVMRPVELLTALLLFKLYLKTLFSLSDSKCQTYSSFDIKSNEKPVSRRDDIPLLRFLPLLSEKSTLDEARQRYNKFVEMLYEDANDVASVSIRPARARAAAAAERGDAPKRGRGRGRGTGRGRATTSTRKRASTKATATSTTSTRKRAAAPTTKRTTRKRSTRSYVDDDESDEDTNNGNDDDYVD